MRAVKLLLYLGMLGAAGCVGNEDKSSAASAQSAEPRSLLELEKQRAESPLQAERRQYDFGAIPIDGGNVETVFHVSNTRPAPLKLVAVYTSCGCTTAMLEFADRSQAGPFGMPGHGSLQTDIDRTVEAGEDFTVRVIFDPAAHGPNGLGKVTRVVTLHTADGGTAELAITADVVRA